MDKKLMMILIPLLVIIVAAIGVLTYLLLSDPADTGKDVYLEQIQSAEKLMKSGDVDQAILHYQNAIKEDKTKEEPYIALANIYYTYKGDIDSAIDILRQGYENTGSENIRLTLEQYTMIHDGQLDELLSDVPKDGDLSNMDKVNRPLLDILSTYTYEMYSRMFSVKNYNRASGVYTVSYYQYDITFEYKDSRDKKVLKSSDGTPYPTVRPTAIYINNIQLLLPTVANGLTVNDLGDVGLNLVSFHTRDARHSTDYILFLYNNAEFLIDCDSSGKVDPDGTCTVLPSENGVTEQGVSEVSLSGRVYDLTSNESVPGATLRFYETGNSTPVCNITARDGNYTANIAPGKYTVYVSADGYTEEQFELEVPVSDIFVKDFGISPTLSAGQIRIVLEWGGTPRDLDSHLEGTSSNGTNVRVDFTNRQVTSGSGTLAELDIDDTDGYGPETITINESGGNYDFYVYNYSGEGSIATSGATVKVYLNNSSQPMILTPPSNLEGRRWDVLSIANGSVTVKDAVRN